MTQKFSSAFSVGAGSIATALFAAALFAYAPVFRVHVALAAHPAGVAGYWAFDDGADPTADVSGHGNNGDVNGGAAFTGAGIAPTPGNAFALTFDGVDDFVEIAHDSNLDMTAAYSISLWANVTDIATYRPILFRGTTNADDIEVYVQSVSGDLIVAHNRGNGGTFDFVGFDNPPAGLFQLVVTYDGTDVKAYYNGVAAAVVQETTTVAAPLDTDKGWWIGKVDHSEFGGTFLFKGLLDEVEIYSRVLTASEIEILSATGNTLFVDSDGEVGFGSIDCDGVGVGAYTTIQGAVDAANSGDTIQICAGTYDEQVVIDGEDLTLQGVGDTTIVRPSASATLSTLYTYPAGTFWPGTVMASIILVKDTGATTIKDLKVDGVNVTTVPAGASRVAGILYGESAGVIDNATVTTMVVDGYATRSYGIDLSAVGTARSVEVKNSDITNWSRNGIQAQGASLTADIHDNTLVGPDDVFVGAAVPNGILFIHGVGGNATGNIISALHHSLSGSRSAGILFYDPLTPGIVAEDNDISDTDDGVNVAHNSNDVIVRNNNLHDNLEVGIHLEDGATNATITGNTITGNLMAGIRFAGAADAPFPDTPPGIGNIANRNNISGNTVGVLNYDVTPQIFDATCNWWGNASGPGPVGPGTGDNVSTNVDFSTWLTTPDLNGPCNGPLPDVTVTIIKYIEGVHATAGNVNSTSFPMQSSWDAVNIGAGSGSFSLTLPTYEAQTSSMTAGADYSTNEDTSLASVGASCADGKPFALLGYTTGGTEAAAVVATLSSTSPAFTGLTSNKYVIVWNKDCTPKLTVTKIIVNDNGGTATTSNFALFIDNATTTSGVAATTTVGMHIVSENNLPGYTATIGGNCDANGNVTLALGESKNCTITNNDIPPPLKVHILKYLDGTKALASTTSSYLFQMESTWKTANLNGGATTTGNYVLGNNHGGAPDLYGADTSPMQAPANYSTHELTGGVDQPLSPEATCQTGAYRLVGYSTSAANFATAASSTVSTTTPSFFGLTSDLYVIVWNEKCVPPPPPPSPIAACNSEIPPVGFTLLNGSAGHDNVTLTPNTMFVGQGGNDKVNGPNGNYVICLGSGHDKVTLGNGEADIDAGSGNNTVKTGNGNGSIYAGIDNDKITTGTGNHTINSGEGFNTIQTGDGTQNVTTGGSADKITTGGGNDTIAAGEGNNKVKAGGGADTITAGAGNDTVDGGAGTDSCNAGGGINNLSNCP
ncbi:MAG TPA: hypothetical protein DEF00_03620 [Candidatus Taylorbacteria bacterium]|nr:MAG: Hemolysin-type calcium-binding region [Parcubacteria group bacterium GW2011_GWA2_47_64]KKU96163.1 MAG: Hemolysin-type calcium-binding region [Parcubacteria group bacterium GW2011_GWC2_48_17]HBV01452.1 hypothetical protein [Candidatus Taylorbacteria bacterium]